MTTCSGRLAQSIQRKYASRPDYEKFPLYGLYSEYILSKTTDNNSIYTTDDLHVQMNTPTLGGLE